MKVGVGVGGGRASRAEWSSQLGQRAGVPEQRGRCSIVAQKVAVCGLLERVAGVWVRWQGQRVLAPVRSLVAELTSFLPAAARPDIGRPEAGDARRERVSRGECPEPPMACCHLCFRIVLSPSAALGIEHH